MRSLLALPFAIAAMVLVGLGAVLAILGSFPAAVASLIAGDDE